MEKVLALVETLLSQLKLARPAADGGSADSPQSVWAGLHLVFGTTLLTAVHLGEFYIGYY